MLTAGLYQQTCEGALEGAVSTGCHGTCPGDSPVLGRRGQAHRVPDDAEEMGSELARLAIDMVPVDIDGVEVVLVRGTAGMA